MIEFAYLDSNALVKLFLAERGSTWLASFVIGREIVISELALFEVAAVLRRAYQDGRIATRTEARLLLSRIIGRSRNYLVAPLGGNEQLEDLIRTIFSLPDALRLRTLDSLHITTANLVLEEIKSIDPTQTFVFVSSDAQLLRAAQTHGFTTENPENHP